MNKQKTKRRTVTVVAALALMAIMLVAFTVAYLTDMRSTLNVLGIGNDGSSSGGGKQSVMIDITEPGFAAETGLTGADLSKHHDKLVKGSILPGDKVMKDPTISNVGIEPVYIRVKLTDDQGNKINFNAGLYEKLNMTIQTRWVEFGDYLYLTDGNGQFVPVQPNAKADIFVVSNDGTKDYTIAIDEKLNNVDLSNLGSVANINVQAEAIQGRGFDPNPNYGDANPWRHSDNTIVVVTANPNRP